MKSTIPSLTSPYRFLQSWSQPCRQPQHRHFDLYLKPIKAAILESAAAKELQVRGKIDVAKVCLGLFLHYHWSLVPLFLAFDRARSRRENTAPFGRKQTFRETIVKGLRVRCARKYQQKAHLIQDKMVDTIQNCVRCRRALYRQSHPHMNTKTSSSEYGKYIDIQTKK